MSSGLTKQDLKTIIQVLEKYSEVETAVLYGSRALGTYQRGSDIDIALKGKKLTDSICSHIHFELEEDIPLPYFFDITDYQSINNEKLKEHIDRVGKVIYGVDESKWQEYYLTQFIEFNPKVKIQSDQKYSFVEMPDLEPGRKYVFPSRKRKPNGLTKFQNGDTLFAKITPCLENGKICQVQGLENNIGVGSTEFFVFRGKKNVSDNDFIHYLLKWYPVKRYAEKNMSGSAGHQRVPAECLHKLKLLLPPYDENKKIGALLSHLDTKIENLQKQNQTLEKIAQTFFKQWFVDFNFPDENGKPYKDNGGEMVGSELEEIPKGWRVGTLREISKKISKGTTPRKKDVEGLFKEIPFLKVKDIANSGLIKLDSLEKIPREIHNNALNRSKLETNDILFSIAGTIGRVAIVSEVLNNSNCNQAIAFIRLSSKDFFLKYVHQWIKSRAIYFEIKSNIVQGVQANVSLTVLGDLQIILPIECIMNSWNDFIKPIYQKLENNIIQTQTLTKTRDTLLPKLMSGQIRVSD